MPINQSKLQDFVIIGLKLEKNDAFPHHYWISSAKWPSKQLKLMEAGLIPANTQALEEGARTNTVVNRYLGPYMEGFRDAFYRPSIPQWNAIEQLYKEAMENIFIRRADVKETLDKASQKMDSLLQSAVK